MEYLEGPLVGNFDFMFEDEEGGAAVDFMFEDEEGAFDELKDEEGAFEDEFEDEEGHV